MAPRRANGRDAAIAADGGSLMAGADANAPLRFLWESFRALLPTLFLDVAGTMSVYYLLLPHFSNVSVWPLLGASFVPVISNIVNGVRRRSVDIVGLIILVGLIAGVAGALLGGAQRLILLRGSFVTGLLGLALLISPFVMRKPIGYYVMREFLTANETLPHEHFDVLWRKAYFRHGVRVITIAWGVLLLGEFVLRGFMALRMSVAFVLGASPVMFSILMILAGAATAVWLGRAISRALQN